MRNYEREPQHFLQSRTTPLNLPFPGGTLLRYPGMVLGMMYYSLKDKL